MVGRQQYGGYPALASSGQTHRIGDWTVEVRIEEDGTRVETAWMDGVKVESRISGTTVTTSIQTDDTLQVVVSDETSPVFTVTTNGEAQEYPKDVKMLREELPMQPERFPVENLLAMGIEHAEDMITPNVTDFLGSPYSRKFLGSMNRYDPIFVGGALYENYYYYLSEHNSSAYTAWTAVSLILGIFTMGFSTWLQIAGSITVIVSGVLVVSDAVTVTHNAYTRQWFKYVEIAQDPNKGI